MSVLEDHREAGLPSNYGLTRRVFLRVALFSALFLSWSSSLWAFFVKRFPIRTVEEDTFHFDSTTGLIQYTHRNRTEPYVLVVDGLVRRKGTFSYSDLKALPQSGQISDFHCVEGWSVKDLRWEGIRFGEIVKRVNPKPEARYAVFHALGTTSNRPDGFDHYVESMPLATLLDGKRECLLALAMDGKPLTDGHGAPLRLVSPYDLGYKSIKYVTRIQFTREQQPGWWTLANPVYPADAPVPLPRLRKK